MAEDYSCGMRAVDGSSVCWGTASWATAGTGEFEAVSAGRQVICGLRVDGTRSCRGVSSAYARLDDGGPFTQIHTGANHACALRADNHELECFGTDNSYGQQNAPEGVQFLSVMAGHGYTCGIRRADHQLSCWGVISR